MKTLCTVFALTLAACASVATPPAVPTWHDTLGATVEPAWQDSRSREYDFWIGEWDMQWRKKQANAFYHERDGHWTHQRVFPVLGGKALIEVAWSRDNPHEPSRRGMSIRYFNDAQQRWVMAQNWPNAKTDGAAFVDQLSGDLHLGRHRLYSIVQQPQPDGSLKTQHRRYSFGDIRPRESFRWEGANTADEGATWSTWYEVDAHYRGDLASLGRAGDDLPGVHSRALCTGDAHRVFDPLTGRWQGTVTADGSDARARVTAGRILDGCGVLAVVEDDAGKTLLTFGYLDLFDSHVIFRLNDRPGTSHEYFIHPAKDAGLNFNRAKDLAIKDEFTPYIASASFDVSDANERLLVDALTPVSLIWREQRRAGPAQPWRTVRRYTLTR